AGGRNVAITKMSQGLRAVVADLVAEGRIDAVLGLGGTGGTDLLGGALQNLGIGVPKLIVSTMASNNVRPYVGHSDMMIMNAVTDIAGLNRISKQVLSNAAHAAAGMARGYEATKAQAEASKPLIAISMFGVTTPGVMRIREQLEDNGFEVVTFHAVGEGAGMEHLIDTGAADCFNFGARNTIPAEFDTDERNIIIHNPNITSLLATPDEMRRLGEYIADHVNRAPGPKAVALPLNGLDNYFKEGSQWHGVDVSPLLDAIRSTLDPSIEVVEMENNINDPEF